jgi:integrase
MRIVKTDSSCVIGGRVCAGIPVFIGENGVDWLPSDWLRKKFRRGLAVRSVATYAEHLRVLMTKMESDRRGWLDIDDEWLERAYSAHLLSGPRAAPQALRTQLAFLMSIERDGFVKGLIGVGPHFKIELGQDGKPLWMRAALAPLTLPNLPTHDAIDSTMAHLAVRDSSLYARNELMMRWQSSAGLRADEVCGLKISELPNRAHAMKLLDDQKGVLVTLSHTKGRSARSLKVHPLLIVETQDWIETDRDVLVCRLAERAGRRGSSFLDPEFVFLSAAGGKMHPGSLSNLIRIGFKEAVRCGDAAATDRVWSHGLRHRGLHDDLKARRAVGQKAAELHTMHHAGHRSLVPTERYVHLEADDELLPVLTGSERRRGI